ncbi:MAG: hypothetical protein R6W76_16045 [Caldilinea sp.]|jgi:hypothetical protein
MMSPYEGERIFEAEMVRLHQCDRSLYACTQRRTEEVSLWNELRHFFGGQTERFTVQDELPRQIEAKTAELSG